MAADRCGTQNATIDINNHETICNRSLNSSEFHRGRNMAADRKILTLMFELETDDDDTRMLIAWLDEYGNGKHLCRCCRPAFDNQLLNRHATSWKAAAILFDRALFPRTSAEDQYLPGVRVIAGLFLRVQRLRALLRRSSRSGFRAERRVSPYLARRLRWCLSGRTEFRRRRRLSSKFSECA